MTRGILFQPDMVRQILAGKKKQTRRIVKSQPPQSCVSFELDPDSGLWLGDSAAAIDFGLASDWHSFSPYAVGDTLVVREAWRALRILDGLKPRELDHGAEVHFEADGPAPDRFGRYRHARFMPMHLARVNLTVSSVRIERLWDISEADAETEGVTLDGGTMNGRQVTARTYAGAFANLWSSINGEASWAANPFVWAISWT